MQEYLDASAWADALRHQLVLWLRCDPACYAPEHPVRGCRGFVAAVLMMEVMRSGAVAGVGDGLATAVLAVLEETETQVRRSHGAESGFAAVVTAKKEEVLAELRRASMAVVEQRAVEEELVDAGWGVDLLVEELANKM